MTSPDEIAAMVVFLLSARAAHITGQHVFVMVATCTLIEL